MKRRDWKIKKLKKIIYDKKLNSNILKKKIPFKRKRLSRRFIRFFTISTILRKLFIRRNKTLLKRSHIMNFFFLKSFVINLKKRRRNYFYNLFLNDNNFFLNLNNSIYLPAFLFKKKLSNYFNKFKEIQDKFQFDYLFYNSLKNSNYNFIKNNKKIHEGSRIYLFNVLEEKSFKNFILEEDNYDIIFKKIEEQNSYYNLTDLNLFFNYNIYQYNILELYKIIIYLYLFNLNKK